VKSQNRPVSLFYFYVMSSPREPGEVYEGAAWRLVPRRWRVGIFSWAFLATTPPHRLNIEYQLADVLTAGCNKSIGIRNAGNRNDAIAQFKGLQACLYMRGVSPFFSQIMGTHSLDDLSDIQGAAMKPEDPRHETASRLSRGDEIVEIWWNQPALSGLPIDGRPLDVAAMKEAEDMLPRWQEMTSRSPELLILQDALVNAAFSPSYAMATLSAWSALESLFPRVQSEVSHRIALYLTRLVSAPNGPAFYREAKKAYALRSSITHGHAGRDLDICRLP